MISWERLKYAMLTLVVFLVVCCCYIIREVRRGFFMSGYGCNCDLPGAWCQDAVKVKSGSDTDWSFQKTVLCPRNFFTISKLLNRTISLQCDTNSTRIISRNVSHSPDIFSVPFGDTCLSRVIKSSCLENRKVPNVVHYVWYNDRRMDFFNFISFMSAVKFVKPCLILIHGPYLPQGIYWEYFVLVFPNVIHVKREHVTVVGANRLAFAEHGSDVMRLQALELYGGLYLDYDEVVLRSVDQLRDYPITLGVEQPYSMGSQFIMAKKGATFLNLWLRSYEIDYKRSWPYNALRVPFELAKHRPDLIHVEGNRFTRPNYRHLHLIFKENYDWSDNYAIHLFSRKYENDFDEGTIGMLNTTLGSVSRYVLYGNKELCTWS